MKVRQSESQESQATMTAKTPSRAELDLRATRKILNILANEPASTKRRIMDFVKSTLDQEDYERERMKAGPPPSIG
jgi:hypothetical protein